MAKKMYIYNLNWDKYIYIVMNIFLKQLKRITNISNHIDIQAAQSHIVSNIEFRGPNVWILILAVVIASVGLNVNSIPVVIGAMLISPLMGAWHLPHHCQSPCGLKHPTILIRQSRKVFTFSRF